MKSRYERLRFLLVFITAHLGSLQCRQQLFPTRIRDIEMKKLLLFVTALCLSSLSFAQVLVATLQHGDSLRVFYYADAFVDAYNAAVPGDVITLSAGSFTTCNIDKDSLTIRGAGIDKTFFASNFYLGNFSNSTMRTLSMEGVFCSAPVHQYRNMEVHFTNVRFGEYGYSNGAKTTGDFVNCIFNIYSVISSSTPTLINCIANSIGDSRSCFINCIVRGTFYHLSHTSFINSILVYSDWNSNYISLPSTALAQNCVGVKENSSATGGIFSSCVNQNSVMATTSIFPNFSMDNLNPERYILSDSAQAQYLGNDSTQVGLYGGFMPYKSTLTYPVISRLNVARQTTADGRLSVDIQVGYRQESEDNE